MTLIVRLALALFVAFLPASALHAGIFGDDEDAKAKSERRIVKAEEYEKEESIDVPIRGFDILGNQYVSKEVIFLALSSKVNEPFDKEKLEKDIEAVRELGYFSHVEHQIVPYEGGMKIVIRVVENPIIRDVQISGNTIVPDERVREILGVKAGTTLNINQLQEGIRQLNAEYTKEGYAFAGVLSQEQFQIDPRQGALRVRIVEPKLGNVTVTGNLKTKTHVITREIFQTLKQGEPIRVEDVKRSWRDVYNLGFFEDVAPPQHEIDMDANTVDLTFEVKEQKTGTASFGGGYSSVSGLIGFIDVAESNFRGLGQTIRAKWQFGGQDSYIFSFVEPWFLDNPVSLGGSVFRTRMDREQFSGGLNLNRFRELRTGYSIVSGWRIDRDERLTASFNDENIELDANIAARGSINSALPPDLAVFDTDGDGIVEFGEQTLGFNWTRDRRDNFINPQSGNRLSLSFSTTGGFLEGINGFNKYVGDYRHYIPIDVFGGAVVAGRFQAGATQVTDGQLRFIDRFVLGGGDTLRGFQDRELTGADFVLGNLELRKDISRIFGMTAFVDVGDAYNSDGRSFDAKTGAGLGARIVTPLGPFRLDYGFPLSDSTRDGRLHFGIGQSF